MKIHSSVSFIGRLAFTFFALSSGALAAVSGMNCESVFLPAPLTTSIRNSTPATPHLAGLIVEHPPLAKQAEAFYTTLFKAAEQTHRSPWVAEYRLLLKIPKDTEELQNLGYRLIKSILLTGEIQMPEDASVVVSVKPVPMQTLIDEVVYDTTGMFASKKTQEKIETELEMLVAQVGSPSERLIIQSSISERSGTFNDNFQTGRTLKSTVIINRNTGVAIEINFFEHSRPRTGGPGVF